MKLRIVNDKYNITQNSTTVYWFSDGMQFFFYHVSIVISPKQTKRSRSC